uniref:BESS domain-containing protein n=1 Tax=Phlebotomus papatasi TaxID=29031 RepID=A0A1B0CZR4_PHLPP
MEKSYSRGRPVHPEYHKLGFKRIKVDGKSSVVCEHCKCVLQNTATKRLRGHRNVCQMTPKTENVKQEEAHERGEIPTKPDTNQRFTVSYGSSDDFPEAVSPKEEDPLNSYSRTNVSSYIELQPPSPGVEYGAYSDDSVEESAQTPVKNIPKPIRTPVPRKRLRLSAEPENVMDMMKQMLETFSGMIQQKSQTHTADYADEAFCNWLLTQFASMSAQRKLRVQHEISNMMFRAQTEESSGVDI